MIKNILLPTDGTEFCEKAVKYGVSLAKMAGAKVTGVTVSVPMRPAVKIELSEAIQRDVAAQSRRYEAAALGVIEAAAKAAGVPCEVVAAQDEHIYQAIIDTAKKKGCDLIVMASHGRRGVAALMLGSETQKILVHSKIPVLVCR